MHGEMETPPSREIYEISSEEEDKHTHQVSIVKKITKKPNEDQENVTESDTDDEGDSPLKKLWQATDNALFEVHRDTVSKAFNAGINS